MSAATEFIVSALILLGAVFALLGSIGLARLPDFFTRLHGPTKATTWPLITRIDTSLRTRLSPNCLRSPRISIMDKSHKVQVSARRSSRLTWRVNELSRGSISDSRASTWRKLFQAASSLLID